MTTEIRFVYSFVLLAALSIAVWIIRSRQQALPLKGHQRWLIMGAAFFGSMIGAKVPFLLEQGWEGVFSGSIWFADGKTILGGIMGGYLAVEIAKAIDGITVRTGDSFAMPIAIAVGIGRIGCFCAGCCYGKVTTAAWGVGFPTAHDPIGIVRHPTQLYEAAFHFAAAVVLGIAYRRRWLEGNQLKAYLLVYMAFRFVTEALRPEVSIMLNLSSYQIACLIFTCFLVGLWLRENRMTNIVRENRMDGIDFDER